MAFTVSLEMKGEMVTFVLDVVEVPRSHNGVNLAIEFQKVLQSFGIEHKVSKSSYHTVD